jgi:hypothetical protein
MPNQNSAPTSDNMENIVNLTQDQLQAMLTQAAAEAVAEAFKHVQTAVTAVPAPAAPVIVGPRQATLPETLVTHRLITWLDKKSTAILTTTRDKVLVPAHVYVADKAIPDTLAVVAAGSFKVALGMDKVTSYFTRLAERSAAKSLARRVQ